MSKWERQEAFGGESYCLRGEGFHVSFNPNPGRRLEALDGDPLYETLKALASPEYRTARNDAPETALVRGDGLDADFRILMGDWREQYEALVPQGWEVCLAFFEANRVLHGSPWTTGRLYPNESKAAH